MYLIDAFAREDFVNLCKCESWRWASYVIQFTQSFIQTFIHSFIHSNFGDPIIRCALFIVRRVWL